MVEKTQHKFRKRDLLYVWPMWFLSLLLPNPVPHRKREFKKRDFLYLAALLLFPVLWPDAHLHYLMILAGIHAILALGLSFFIGYTGQVSLGHAAFFGIGAYTTALLTTRLDLTTLAAFWASGLAAAAMAFFIGRPLLKLKGYFLAVATLGLGEIFLVFVKETPSLTNGVIGVFGVPWFSFAGFSFDTDLKQYYLIWSVLIGLLLFSKNLVRSKVGRAFLAVGASEDGAASLGIDAAMVKLGAFVLGAVFAGFAGSLFVCVLSTANPETFGLTLSVQIVMMVILGGMANLYGPIGGAILLTWLMDALGKYQEFSLPAYGLILILMLIFFPDGIGTRLGARFVYLISYFPRKRRREEGEL